MFSSHRNQSIDFQCKSIYWLLYARNGLTFNTLEALLLLVYLWLNLDKNMPTVLYKLRKCMTFAQTDNLEMRKISLLSSLLTVYEF